MKGVSEIIAIVLILMIVIALAALAWTWFSGTLSTMLGTAGSSVSQTTNAMATQFAIETAVWNSKNVTVSIINTGTQTIDLSKLQAYIDRY